LLLGTRQRQRKDSSSGLELKAGHELNTGWGKWARHHFHLDSQKSNPFNMMRAGRIAIVCPPRYDVIAVLRD
jgi:hypothetical protein